MSQKLTAKQLELMQGRKTLLDESMKALCGLIAGQNNSLAPFIADGDGKISEKCVNALITAFINCLNRRRRLEKLRPLPSMTEELYRAFLYLALLSPYLCDNGSVRPAESFSDIAAFAKGFEESGFEEYGDFLMADLNGYVTRYCYGSCNAPYEPIYGSFGILLWVMRDFMEHFALQSFSRDDQIWLCEKYAGRHSLSAEDRKHLTDDVLYQLYDFEKDMENYDRYMRELAEQEEAEQRAEYEKQVSDGSFSGTFAEYRLAELDRSIPITDEDIERLNQNAETVENVNAVLRLLDTISDPKRYCDCFDTFAKLYFQCDREAFVNDISDMLDTFLFEHRLSAFSFGDGYLMINHYLEQFRKRVEKELARGRGK